MRSLEFFLKILKEKFEKTYNPILKYPEILKESEKTIFANFDQIVKEYL